jgi:nitrite reductase/ring-hydroxylating ferredoxin subunit
MNSPCSEQIELTEDPVLKEPGFVCPSSAIRDREHGMRFRIVGENDVAEAFIVRFRGTLHGYINRCPHVPADAVTLDEPKGVFFDRLGRFLVCRRHSALFDAASGACVRGPCRGASLSRIDVVENEDGVFWLGAGAPGDS